MSSDNWKKRFLDYADKPVGRFLLLQGPIQALLFSILLFPFLLEIYLSLSAWEPGPTPWFLAEFNYGQSFVQIVQDIRFLLSVGRTFLITGIAVTAEFLLGLAGALIFSKSFRGKKVLTSIFLIPMFFMPIIVAYNFWMIFQPQGPLNYIISLIIGRPFLLPWLSREIPALIAIILTDIWEWTPFMFLIMTSGIMALPENPISAAKVLGASDWQVFRMVKLPMLKNIIIIALVIRFMEAIKIFDTPFIMTGGGPGFATETLSIYTFIISIQNGRLGYGAAAALILLISILLLITPAVRPILRRR